MVAMQEESRNCISFLYDIKLTDYKVNIKIPKNHLQLETVKTMLLLPPGEIEAVVPGRTTSSCVYAKMTEREAGLEEGVLEFGQLREGDSPVQGSCRSQARHHSG